MLFGLTARRRWAARALRFIGRRQRHLSNRAKRRKQDPVQQAGGHRAVLAALILVPLLAALALSATGHTLLPSTYLSALGPWKTAEGPAVGWDSLLWDGMAQFYPWRAYAGRWVSRGVLPLWNPHQFCGTPFLANGQSALLYPPNWLFAVVGPEHGFAWTAALHLAFAAAFTFLLLRSLGCSQGGAAVGAVAFPLNGFFALWIHLPTAVQSVCWLPFLCYAAERVRGGAGPKWVGLGALGVAGAVLAGHLQMAFYVLATFLLWSLVGACCAAGPLRRKALGYLLGTLALGGAICAAQLLPSSELAGWSQRGAAKSMETFHAYLRFALPPVQLVTLALPGALGRTFDGDYLGRGTPSEYALYVGALVLLFAFWSRPGVNRRAWWFAFALAAFSLLSALGTWVNAVPFFLIPGFERLGGPARILALWPFALALLAGMGATHAERMDQPSARRPGIVAVCLFVGSLTLTALPLILLGGARAGAVLLAAAGSDLRSSLFLALALAFAVLTALGGLRFRKALVAALPLLLVADLGTFWAASILVGKAGQAYPPNAVVAAVERSGKEARVVATTQSWPLNRYPRAAFPPNAAMAYGIDDLQGYDSLFMGRYKDLLARFLGRDPSPPACGNMVLVPEGAWPGKPANEFFAVTHLMTARDAGGGATQSGGTVVTEVELAPRVYRSEASRVLSDEASVLAALPGAWAAAGPPPTLLIAQGPELSGRAEPQPLHWDRPQPNLLRVAAEGDGEALVVARETYAPGWRAYVDGSPAPVLRADFLFRAVPAAGGTHSVWMAYEPSGFRLGMFVTLLSLAVAIGAFAAAAKGGQHAQAR